jgi:adenylylsulfate kinase-like enzyme
MEVFMDVPLDVVQDRDPKGLYKKVSWAGAHDRKLKTIVL